MKKWCARDQNGRLHRGRRGMDRGCFTMHYCGFLGDQSSPGQKRCSVLGSLDRAGRVDALCNLRMWTSV